MLSLPQSLLSQLLSSKMGGGLKILNKESLNIHFIKKEMYLSVKYFYFSSQKMT